MKVGKSDQPDSARATRGFAAPVNMAGDDDAAPGFEVDGVNVPPGVVGVVGGGVVAAPSSVVGVSVGARSVPGVPGKPESSVDVAGVSTTTVVVSPELVGVNVVVVVSVPGVAIVVVQSIPSTGVFTIIDTVPVAAAPAPPIGDGIIVEVLGVAPQ